ncbi:MAG: TIGR02147 family protein [Deltaproteobacteria bacterium]|nr:TIGR02147 family protein [Deltaproteobacteria bacterium]
MPDIYTYTDYRAFLRDAYAEAKARFPHFSYRYFARHAGFSSPNFLKLVIEGKRNLSEESIPKFAQVFQLKRRERRFFEMLVRFNQAKRPEEQEECYRRILEFPEYCRAQELVQEQYEYLTHWYYPVIQELIVLPDFEESGEWVAGRLRHQVTPVQARKALEVLERLGLVARTADGLLQPTQQHITTGDFPRAAAAYRYHEEMMARALDALHAQPASQREYGGLTLSVNEEQLKRLKTAIRDFRRVVLNVVSPGTARATAVYQLNIQLFGHTNFPGGES